MDPGDADASLSEHFVQSLSRGAHQYQNQPSDGLLTEHEAARLPAALSSMMTQLYQPSQATDQSSMQAQLEPAAQPQNLTIGSMAQNLSDGQNLTVAQNLTVPQNLSIAQNLSGAQNFTQNLSGSQNFTQNLSGAQNLTVVQNLTAAPNQALTQNLNVAQNLSGTQNPLVSQRVTIAQNLTKQTIPTFKGPSEARFMSGVTDRIALLPVGSSGTEFVPVRIGQLAANLPLLAKKLSTISPSNSTPLVSKLTPQAQSAAATPIKREPGVAIAKKKLLSLAPPASSEHARQQLPVVDCATLPDKNLAASYLESSTDSLSYYTDDVMPKWLHSQRLNDALQPVTSPVYKSKLEKAMAQNQMMQNTAKESRQAGGHQDRSEQSKALMSSLVMENIPVPVPRQSRLPDNSAMVAEISPLAPHLTAEQLLTNQLPLPSQSPKDAFNAGASISAKDIFNSHATISTKDVLNSCAFISTKDANGATIKIQSGTKPTKKDIQQRQTHKQDIVFVTKVAERYKDMVFRQTTSASVSAQQAAGNPKYHLDQSLEQPATSLEQPPTPQYTNYEPSQFIQSSRNQDVNFAYSELTNTNAIEPSFTYFASPTPYIQPMERENHAALVTEKVYNDAGIARSILAQLWQLRESCKYCDAVIYTCLDSVQLHKIVLIAACPKIAKKYSEETDSDMKLLLPEGIMASSLHTFVYYIYHGTIRLTVDNVQQIYRLSCIFGVEELGKYCYDFCKEGKIGHLIIASPYQEAATQLDANSPPPPTERSTGKRRPSQTTSVYSPTQASRNQRPQSVSDKPETSHEEANNFIFEKLGTPQQVTQAEIITTPTSCIADSHQNMVSSTDVNTLISSQNAMATESTQDAMATASRPDAMVTAAMVTESKPDVRHGILDTVATLDLRLPSASKPESSKPSTQSVKATDDRLDGAEYMDDISRKTKMVFDALEADWIVNDPSQSNIPIRKRRRNRKGVTGASTSVTESVASTGGGAKSGSKDSPQPGVAAGRKNSLTDIQQSSSEQGLEAGVKTLVKDPTIENKAVNEDNSKQNMPATSIEKSSNFNTLITQLESPKAIPKPSSQRVVNSTNAQDVKNKKPAVVKLKKSKIVGLKHLPVHPSFTEPSLPDPLVSGKLDESELLKLDNISAELGEMLGKPSTTSVTVTPKKTSDVAGVTRFRRRPANMSVLEVASQKKAKSNDTSALYSTQKSTRTRPREKRTSPNTKPPQVVVHTSPKKSPVTKGDTAVHTKASDSDNVAVKLSDVVGGQIQMKGSEVTAKMEPKSNTRSVAEPALYVQKAGKVAEILIQSSGSEKQLETIQVTAIAESSQDVDRGTRDITEADMAAKDDVKPGLEEDMAAAVVNMPPQPKKARLRKHAGDQFDPKDKVYMRPPPKKRTKEIREMMKNEEVDKIPMLSELDPSTANPQNIAASKATGNLKRESVSKKKPLASVPKKKPRVRKPRVRNEAMMEKVTELDISAQHIDGERLFRCCFCDSAFMFAKRALSHVVLTHEITVDDCAQYVTAEHKNAPTKDSRVCDICGYKTKEVGVYYIHFHKYFRHQVPLPKGWKPFTCDLCKKEFFTKFQLREHKLLHFEDNPFVCDTCGSRFRSRTCLNSHIFHKHNKVKQYTCPECPKTFKTRTQIKVHQRIHSGEKPFKCPIQECIYRSTTRGNMKLHLGSKHKLSNAVVKPLMAALRDSETPSFGEEIEGGWKVSLVGAGDMAESDATMKTTRKDDIQTDVTPLEILVLTDVNESVNMTGNESYTMNGTNQAMNVSSAAVPQEFDGHVPASSHDKTHQLTDIRDFGQLVQGNVLSATGTEAVDQHELPTQNIPRHVQMLIHDVSSYHQHQADSHSQIVADLNQAAISASTSATYSRSHSQQTPLQLPHYDSHADVDLSRYTNNTSGNAAAGTTEHSKIIDPQSREARMILKEALENHTHRVKLLKSSSMLQPAASSAVFDDHAVAARLGMEGRGNQDNSHPVAHSPLSFHEADNLVIDLQDTATQAEDQVVQTLRNQIQQLRGTGNQYRDPADGGSLLRGDHNVTELLQNIASSQHQALDAGHFQSYHQPRGNSPTVYQPSSHGQNVVAMPVSDLDTHSTVTLNPAHPGNEGQGQMSQDQQGLIPVQGYNTIVPHTSQTGPYSSTDGNLYHGYYEEQYDIENY